MKCRIASIRWMAGIHHNILDSLRYLWKETLNNFIIRKVMTYFNLINIKSQFFYQNDLAPDNIRIILGLHFRSCIAMWSRVVYMYSTLSRSLFLSFESPCINLHVFWLFMHFSIKIQKIIILLNFYTLFNRLLIA